MLPVLRTIQECPSVNLFPAHLLSALWLPMGVGTGPLSLSIGHVRDWFPLSRCMHDDLGFDVLEHMSAADKDQDRGGLPPG